MRSFVSAAGERPAQLRMKVPPPKLVRALSCPLLSSPLFMFSCVWRCQVDVEANTLSVLAFRYTSITSVAMLDAFSIPGKLATRCSVCREKKFGGIKGLAPFALKAALDTFHPVLYCCRHRFSTEAALLVILMPVSIDCHPRRGDRLLGCKSVKLNYW